jgi:hypothetical protein
VADQIILGSGSLLLRHSGPLYPFLTHIDALSRIPTLTNAIMANTNLGNDYVDNAELTYHCCARCIAWLADGYFRYLGKVGCCMPTLSENNAKDLEEYTAKGVLKCFRCWQMGGDCCVVSDWVVLGNFGPY